MNFIKRCWGCGKRILPWQKITHTKLVGDIHKGCAFRAAQNYGVYKQSMEFKQRCEESALKRLNEEETK